MNDAFGKLKAQSSKFQRNPRFKAQTKLSRDKCLSRKSLMRRLVLRSREFEASSLGLPLSFEL
jgi:hypothetical protein